jgi:hypothetical protein
VSVRDRWDEAGWVVPPRAPTAEKEKSMEVMRSKEWNNTKEVRGVVLTQLSSPYGDTAYEVVATREDAKGWRVVIREQRSGDPSPMSPAVVQAAAAWLKAQGIE